MPQIKITLDDSTYEKLKELADKDERSTTQYISRLLRQSAGTLILPQTPPTFYPINQSNPNTTNITVEDLKNLGVTDFKFAKPAKQLTPEEQKLQEIKIQEKEDKIKQQREQKWYEAAKKFMKDYWDDDACRGFAHRHIYREQHLSLIPGQTTTLRLNRSLMIPVYKST